MICVKVFKPYTDTQSKGCAEEEYKVGQLMRGHDNVINITSFEQDKPITIEGKEQTRDFLTLDYCEHSDLFSYMSTFGKRQDLRGLKKTQGQGLIVKDKPLLIAICKQLINGIQGLHEKAGMAHMDIKLENILIANDGHLKFCDFGFA